MWWRDDDAAEPTRALRRLLALSDEAGVPVGLAVIPRSASVALARELQGRAGVSVLQHGFAHLNHAPSGEKKSEFGAHRSVEVMADEIARGRQCLKGLFRMPTPVFVPPWNRLAAALIPMLAGLGLEGLSSYGPRPGAQACAALRQVNCHVDLVDWRGTRGFIGDRAALRAVVGHLESRRLGAADGREPTGILTHHLDHDEGCWAFLGRFLAASRTHPAVRWLDAEGALWAS